MKLRVCKSREDLIAVLLERQDELNISASTIDGIAGLADSYTSKCLCVTPSRNLGPVALGAILGALGLGIVEIVIREDPEAVARVSGRWVPRKRRAQRKAAPEPAEWCLAKPAQTAFNFESTREADMANKMIGVRVDPELEARLKAAAERDRRKMSDYVRLTLSDALDKTEQTNPEPKVDA